MLVSKISSLHEFHRVHSAAHGAACLLSIAQVSDASETSVARLRVKSLGKAS